MRNARAYAGSHARQTAVAAPRQTSYRTTAAYLSGGICGPIWWPAGAICGRPINADLRAYRSRIVSADPITFRDIVEFILSENDGDFQSGKFTADTVIRVERRRLAPDGTSYTVHVFERELAAWPAADLADLVDGEHWTGDFLGGEE